MKIKFMGAAQTVTGSCFIVETKTARFAVDCGLHQGGAEIEKRNWDTDIYQPQQLDFIVITHAHIDHCGLLPRLVQKGFRGLVYATEPTGDLMNILLLDSAHIHEVEAGWNNKKLQRNGKKANFLPLYSTKDAEAVNPLIRRQPYNETFSPSAEIKIIFRNAGHILGSAMVEIVVIENEREIKLVFSGDIGRPQQLLMHDPVVIGDADYLFMESTYGNRNHKGEEESLEELASAIAYSYRNGQKVIIPAFAVERTQEIIYSLYLLSKQGKLPRDMPVYLDSPLAIKATKIFQRYLSHFDPETQAILNQGEDPLRLPQLVFSLSTEQSMQINELQGPAIVISASGMANAGRIKHHLRHNLWRDGASIVFVGFQAEGTTGRCIVDGAQKIRIFNEEIAVKAKIFTINGFSAHAGQDQLLDWLGNFRSPKMQLFLVHGEFSAQTRLAAVIREKLGFSVSIPEYLEEIKIAAGVRIEETKQPRIVKRSVEASQLVGDLKSRLDEIYVLMEKIDFLPASEQEEAADLLKQATGKINKFRAG